MKVFLDTNILAYSVDCTDKAKNSKAVSIVQSALRKTRDCAISVQILTEFCNVALRKLAMPPDAVLDFLEIFRKIETLQPDSALVTVGPCLLRRLTSTR